MHMEVLSGLMVMRREKIVLDKEKIMKASITHIEALMVDGKTYIIYSDREIGRDYIVVNRTRWYICDGYYDDNNMVKLEMLQ